MTEKKGEKVEVDLNDIEDEEQVVTIIVNDDAKD